jgi:hypothetical protein
VPAPDSAEHRVQLTWRPQHADQPGVEDDLFAFRFYRMLFGFSAQRDELSWVRVLERDVVGAAKQSGGLFVVEDSGALSFVDQYGQMRFKRELGKKLRVATVRPGAFPTEADAGAFQAPAEASAPLHDRLLAAATLDDNRLAPGRALAVQYLARTSEPSVTRELIALCAHATARDAAQSTACDELSKRQTGSQDVLEALRARPSWLDGTDQPPVGALAQAAVRMQLKQAGPLLMNHADDPYTPVPDLVQVFIALQNLQVRAAVPQLERFVRLHHAEPAGSELAPALQGALLALGALQGQKARPSVNAVADDTLTLPVVQQTAREVLAALDHPPAPPAPEAKTPAKKVKIVVEEPVLTTDPRPYALEADDVQKAFRPLNAGLERCLDADPAHPKSARMSMIINGEGKVEGALVTPTTLQGCVEPILRNARFPATRLGRQHLVQTIHANAKPKAEAETPAPKTASADAKIR